MTERRWRCGPFTLALGRRTVVMAIVNVTPDSFTGDGMAGDSAAVVEAAELAVAAGADIVDVGGESTRPGNTRVSAEDELARVLPAVVALVARLPVPISVDTSKPEVAVAALDAGAAIVNDVSGLAERDTVARIVGSRAGLVLMRFAGFPYNRPRERMPEEGDLIEAVRADLAASARCAGEAGVPGDAIVLDPGFGFGLLAADSLLLLRRLGELQPLGYPLLVGASLKGFTGQPSRLPVGERQWGTAAAHALAIAGGADIIRAHDVVAARRVADFTDLVVRPTAEP